MKSTTRTIFFFALVLALFFKPHSSRAQSATSANFLAYQRSIPKVSEMMHRKEDTLIRQFRAKNLAWPARYLYLRSFKYDSELEVWVKNKRSEKYTLFKKYKVCALAGSLGPKRMAGDYQVPEGFYFINEFNPKSLYHYSLGLNYPNLSDKLLSDLSQPGGDIYIHGSCVTTGCIPITDWQIEELYVLAAHAKDLGQDFIPVHIFPVNFDNQRSVFYLNKFLQNFPEYGAFERSMRSAFYFFEHNRQVPPVVINSQGDYLFDDPQAKPSSSEDDAGTDSKPSETAKPVKAVQPIPDSALAQTVDRLPLFPGGNEAFRVFVDKLSKDMVKQLAPGVKKAFILVEYIVDAGGKLIYANALSGGNETMNASIEKAFRGSGMWTPASRSNRNVPIKMKQTIIVEQ